MNNKKAMYQTFYIQIKHYNIFGEQKVFNKYQNSQFNSNNFKSIFKNKNTWYEINNFQLIRLQNNIQIFRLDLFKRKGSYVKSLIIKETNNA